MIKPSICPSLRLLPLTVLALGSLPVSADPLETWNDQGSAYLRLASPDQVIDPEAAVPGFRELYTFPIEEDLSPDATDIWVIRNVRSRAFSEQIENGQEEDPETVNGARYFAHYQTWNRETRRASESGMVGWRFAEDFDTATGTSGTIGFIRATQRPSELPAEPVVGHFSEAEGSLSWAVKSTGSRVALIDLKGAAYRPEHRFSDFVSLTVTPTGVVTLGGFDFPVPDLSPMDLFRFDTSAPQQVAEGVYFDIISRFDGRTEEEVHPEDGPLPEGEDSYVGDPSDFWSRHYFLFLVDDQDSDRDGIPDFADLTHTFVDFPWYADFDQGNNWYYAAWSQSWIYSDRRVSESWDYSLDLGWTHVPLSSSRNHFWAYLNSRIVSTQRQGEDPVSTDDRLGWLYTNRTYFPNYYRAATGEVLQLLPARDDQPADTAVFYNFSQERFETAQF